MSSKDEYLVELRRKVDALKARAELPAHRYATKEQDRIRSHFLQRAIQLGEACFLISDLVVPLYILLRVLCEDLFLLFWISLSDANATDYAKAVVSELARLARVNLDKGRAKIIQTSTGQDKTASVLPEFSKLIVERSHIETIAINSGLGKVYDVLYRFASLEVHGKTFGLFPGTDDEAIMAALPAIISLEEAILTILDKPPGATTAQEVLAVLKLERFAGK